MRKLMRLLVDNHDLQLRFQWHDVNDLAIRDNRCTFHAATQDHFGKGTGIGWRCMTMGEIPSMIRRARAGWKLRGVGLIRQMRKDKAFQGYKDVDWFRENLQTY